MNTKLTVLVRAATAGAPIAFFAVAPADAFVSGFPQQVRQEIPLTPAPSDGRKSIRRSVGLHSAAPSRTSPSGGAKPSPATTAQSENPKGPYEIIISLDKQQLTLYAGGKPIAQSRISTGQAGHRTPTGVFSVIEKDRWHHSNLYDNAPMYFMQRITWSGVAMHEGIVPNHPASHGCIRLPGSFARQLWGTTGLGARVIIAHGTLAPAEISHPRLFTPKPPPAPVPYLEALESAHQPWIVADRAGEAPQPAVLLGELSTVGLGSDAAPVTPARPLREGPVSVFVSRKEGKLFVRKGFEPIFDLPVAIENPDQPLGTHVFTAIAAGPENASMRWNVVTVTAAGASSSPAAALDRITIPPAVLDRISELMSPGASLIISDQGLSRETGKGTDFIVLTR